MKKINNKYHVGNRFYPNGEIFKPIRYHIYFLFEDDSGLKFSTRNGDKYFTRKEIDENYNRIIEYFNLPS